MARSAAEELTEQLRTLAFDSIHELAVADEGLEHLRSVLRSPAASTTVLFVDARLVAHGAALRASGTDPRTPNALLVGRESEQGPHWPVRIDRGVVVGCCSPLHEPLTSGSASLGVLRLDVSALPDVDGALVSLREQVGTPALLEALDEAPVEVLSCVALAAGIRLSATDLRGLVAGRARGIHGADLIRSRRAEVDEDRAWLDAAVKAEDGWFTTFFVSPYSRFLARWAARRGHTPNQVTVASMAVGSLAAGLFAAGERWTVIVGALALQLSFSLDCVDGQLSRYTQRFTAFGGWLDSTFDRAKETLIYAGLAVWGARTGVAGIWALATAALAFQALRHAIDLAFMDHRPGPKPVRPTLSIATDGGDVEPDRTGRPAGGRVLEAAGTAEGHPLLRWAKRIIVLPIGERFALISLTAIVAGPRLTFLLLIAWGFLATAYLLTGRLLRARTWPQDRGSWLVTPGYRAVEYATVVAVAVLVEEASVAAYALVAVSVTRHYDEVYRSRSLGADSVRTVARLLVMPWPARVLLVLVAVATGWTQPVLWSLAALVGTVTAVDAWSAWRRGAGTLTVDPQLEEVT